MFFAFSSFDTPSVVPFQILDVDSDITYELIGASQQDNVVFYTYLPGTSASAWALTDREVRLSIETRTAPTPS